MFVPAMLTRVAPFQAPHSTGGAKAVFSNPPDMTQIGGLVAHDPVNFVVRVSKNSGYHLGVPIIRIVIFWGLYWGPPVLGKYHVELQMKR